MRAKSDELRPGLQGVGKVQAGSRSLCGGSSCTGCTVGPPHAVVVDRIDGRPVQLPPAARCWAPPALAPPRPRIAPRVSRTGVVPAAGSELWSPPPSRRYRLSLHRPHGRLTLTTRSGIRSETSCASTRRLRRRPSSCSVSSATMIYFSARSRPAVPRAALRRTASAGSRCSTRSPSKQPPPDPDKVPSVCCRLRACCSTPLPWWSGGALSRSGRRPRASTGETSVRMRRCTRRPRSSFCVLWLCYPFIKRRSTSWATVSAVKAWGGEGRETGISLLLLVPVPFVDASSASSFPEKHRRAVLGAAWHHGGAVPRCRRPIRVDQRRRRTVRETGRRSIYRPVQRQSAAALRRLLRAVRPARRSQPRYACERLCGLSRATSSAEGGRGAVSPVTANGEPPLLLGYAVLAFCYRWVVSGLIVFWCGSYSFWLGVLAAGLALEHGGEAARGRCRRQRPRAASPPCSTAPARRPAPPARTSSCRTRRR